jgi:hypothetical protein
MANIVEYILGLKSDGFQSGINGAIGSTRALDSAFDKVKTTALGFFGAYEGLAFINKSVDMFNESAQASAQLDATLRSTANAANLNRDALDKQSEALMKKSLFDDDAITSSQSLLATFTKVKDTIYMDAIPAIVDMSTKMGGDLQGTTLQVGKALNDPIKGIAALSRAGVSFTESQKATIKSMVAMNDVAGAQKLILQELQTEFGGSALAASQVGTGPMVVLQHIFEGVREEIGGMVMALIIDLKPALESMIQGLSSAVHWVKENGSTIKALVYGFGVFRVAMITVVPLIEGFTIATTAMAVAEGSAAIATTALLGPLGLVAIAIGALAAAYVYLSDSADRAKKAQKEQADSQKKEEQSGLEASYNYLKEHGVKTENLRKQISEKAIIQADLDIKEAKDKQAALAKLQAPARNPYKESGDVAVESFWANKTAAEKQAAQDLMNAEARKQAAIDFNSRALGKAGKAGAGLGAASGATPPKTDKATGSKSVTINMQINDIVKEFTINTTNIKEGANRVKDIITDALLNSINSSLHTAGQ